MESVYCAVQNKTDYDPSLYG